MLMIRKFRQAKSMTQQQLAEATGIRRTNITRYEIGQRTPKITDAKKIADALNCTIDDLFKSESTPTAK